MAHRAAAGGQPALHAAPGKEMEEEDVSDNIEALKEHHHNHGMVGRPSVMHHVGKAPDLHMLQSPGQGGNPHMGGGEHMGAGEGGVSLPHRDMQGMHMASGKDQGGQGGSYVQDLPRHSVLPIVGYSSLHGYP